MFQRRPNRLAAAAAAILALTLSACTGSGDDSDAAARGNGSSNGGTYKFSSATTVGSVIAPKDRKPAEDFSGTLLDGKGKTTLAARKGKPTVIAFWASWCGPCKVEMPQLNDLHLDIGNKVNFLGVDTQDDRGSASAFVENNKIAFPIVEDRNGETALTLGNIPGSLPFTVLVDKDGKVAAVYVQRYAPKDMQRALAKLTAES